jgi:hypothetical protein
MSRGEEDEMPESGEWFSPRTRPEMLTSDDPPVPVDKPELVQILPGPAGAVGRATAPVRRLVEFVPAIGRRIVRVDDEPSRWQLVGMWATGSAIVAATGLAVATVLGGAPPALTQPFERLSVLPGLSSPDEHDQTVTSADKASGDSHRAPARDRTSVVDSRARGSFSTGRDTAAYPSYPEDLVPGRPLSRTSGSGTVVSGGHSAGSGPGVTVPAPPAGGGGGGGAATPPATSPTTPPASEPTQEPTDPGTPPTEDPTPPPADPTEDPTVPATPPDDPPPPDTPPDDPPTDEPAQPPADPPVADAPADPAPPTETAPTATSDPTPPPTTP